MTFAAVLPASGVCVCFLACTSPVSRSTPSLRPLPQTVPTVDRSPARSQLRVMARVSLLALCLVRLAALIVSVQERAVRKV